MASMAAPRRLAGFGWVCGAEIEHLSQRLAFQVWLVSQHNRPVRENLLPPRPLGGAPD